MDEKFQNLTTIKVNAEPSDFGFISAGSCRRLADHTLLCLHVNKENDQYKPAIVVFHRGKQVKPEADQYCFNLVKQTGQTICIRGLRFYANGRPASFLVETYRPQQAALRVIK